MHAAIVHANAITASAGTTFSRITAGRNSPTTSTTRPPTLRTQERRERLPVDVRALDVGGGEQQRRHRLATTLTAWVLANFAARPAAAWACAGAIVARSDGSERLSPNCG